MTARTCSIDGCDKPYLARGWCAMHYMRWRNNGEPGEAELRRVPGDPSRTEKPCTICGEVQQLDQFYGDGRCRDGRMSHCKRCFAIRDRARKILRKYGLTMEQHDQMLVDQDGLCAICGADDDLVIDHCHDTGAVRALVCDPCNRAMGCVGDDPARLRAAADYLEVHRMLTTTDREVST